MDIYKDQIMLNTLGRVCNRPFYLYKIIREGREAIGVLARYCQHYSEHLNLLPHEQISMSHAMKIKKILQSKKAKLPPCALIADLDFSVLNWRENTEQLAHWYNDNDNCEHYLYRLYGGSSTRLLAEQLAKLETLLIADGHHRAFAASLPHAPLTTLPVWITSTCVEVDSFALSLETQADFDLSALKQQLKTFGIEACSPSDGQYLFSFQQQQESYCYPTGADDSYKIQHQLRVALRQIKGVKNLTPLTKKCISEVQNHSDTLLIRLTAPKITDIIKAAKKGHHFPEKSTYFPHKACARVLALTSA